MARSVSTHTNAIEVVYINGSDIDEDFLWQDFTDDLTEIITKHYPSFEEIDSWNGREVHEILSNNHTVISVSEYCGLISVSISPRENDYSMDGLAIAWTKRNASKMAKLIENNFEALKCVGRFSNGEAVYERITINA